MSSAKLILEDGSVFTGRALGGATSTAGEVVFNTGMVGYPECFTDPSYRGQILVLTYPLIGNYGVPSSEVINGSLDHDFESPKIQIAGLIISEYSADYSHWKAQQSLDDWLKKHRVPALCGVDTRLLTRMLREQGSMLGKLVVDNSDVEFVDPNVRNLVAEVSPDKLQTYGEGKKRLLLIDCGCKLNIIRSLVKRGVSVSVAPWDFDMSKEQFDGLVISNGPGSPKMAAETIKNVRSMLQKDVPIFGICLGNQILALAAGADTYKLNYGHRSQNQPCVMVGSKRCFITSQNHGFAVDEKSLPVDWEPWFFNANDGTNEGIRHRTKPFISVQFHPEANPGPVDTAFLFDEFLTMI
ncbi:MAG: glutamine-hydrolyzing carbamoyl-phosphate synthase small subunit [bacterium]